MRQRRIVVQGTLALAAGLAVVTCPQERYHILC